MNAVEMMHIVIMAFLAMMAGAEMKRKTNVVFVYEDLLDKVYNLFTQKNRKTETEAGQEYSAPYWLQIVDAHGFEKALRGVVNTLKNGGQLVAEVMVFALYNKGVREMNAIPWQFAEQLSKLKTQLECGCQEMPYEGIPSCEEILETTIEWMLENFDPSGESLPKHINDPTR
tara:strand:+ start:1772 stop:2287 length:516 start_codon:yes stop_codon:yes gene_type:complete